MTYRNQVFFSDKFMMQVEPRKYSIYREAAVDAITVALEESLTDEKIQEKCCRALLILGGRFSFSREVANESWILKPAGFNDRCEGNSLDNDENDLPVDDSTPLVCLISVHHRTFLSL